MRLIYHPDAEAELIEAAQFYERRMNTLGAQFLNAIEQAVEAIRETPTRYRVVEADIRHHLVRRFPYARFITGFYRMSFASSRSSTIAATPIIGVTAFKIS